MRSSEKAFIERFEAKVKRNLEEECLASPGQKILVACSGGKDSTTVLYLMKKFGYRVEAIMLDLLLGDYSRENRENVEAFCRAQGVKLHLVDYRRELGQSVCFIRSAVQEKEKIKNCHVCGVLKKHLLNKKARKLKAKRLATGHNLDDEAQTFLMNMLRGNPGLSAGAGPKTGNQSNEKFVARIKPLFYIPEAEVRRYAELKGFPVVFTRCPCGTDAFRGTLRRILDDREERDGKVKFKLVRQMQKLQPGLKRGRETAKLNHCRHCGEPSSQEVCRACRLLEKVRS